MLLTDPVQNVAYALIFFAVLFVLFLSLGHVLAGIKPGRINPVLRSRAVIASVLLTIFLMFRSAGSLNWVDILVMLLLGAGLLFYSGRRPQ